MRTSAALGIGALLISACAVSVSEPAELAPTTTAPSTTAVPEEAVTAVEDPPCLQGDRPFSSSGVISAFGGATGDAAQISGIRTGFHAACERIVIDMLTVDGAPAGSVGLVGVDFDEIVGVIRINLPPAISESAIADLLLDGELADRAFVVQTLSGNLALDVHVAAGARVALRAFEVTSPSRIVVDLRPEPESTPTTGAAAALDVVVTKPPLGSGGVPLEVSGYARPGAAVIEARIHENKDTEPVAVESTRIAQSTAAWNEFETTFYDPPRGTVELYVGTDLTGVWLDVDNGPLQLLGGEDA